MAKDTIFVKTLDSIEDYLALQQQLQEALKKGLFSMAQAKYSMGPFGQAQYNMDMQASATVSVIENTDSDSLYDRFELNRAPGQPPTSSTKNRTSPASAATSSATSTSKRQATETHQAPSKPQQPTTQQSTANRNSRDRANQHTSSSPTTPSAEAGTSGMQENADPGVDSFVESLSALAVKEEGGGSSKRGIDPLHWFGVLVPPTLREAQRSFVTVLELCVKLANASQQIREGAEELSLEAGSEEGSSALSS
mmetsp:Transcript_3518/g.7675  ORF Transcript_3518/g.7675 Transcript_3518/m.7675 type:complete len:252 (-) Transcript_3518:409-1164(-)|eukprot:CAMPEP_0202897246 /NCGR_PEP_ID=MMETSP1392-20130828/6066_1 /ASSEMBLY_ACC=CAM_ASM_000868 /TAXON_ID=225041 /ORGANISM="Chlamydomonas chlamydogama, Strain SAG 11-48b" /LENGTH=251 /DNA_ID=CAMNT_0049582841 /DNA_START=32 /DNA_END=787 /DNA_ORIENTATION=-